MKIKEFFSFKKNKLFWINLGLMVITLIFLLIVVMKWLDSYTNHGEGVVVPNVKGMAVNQASTHLKNMGLNYIVSDSNYVKGVPAGNVLDYSPSAGQTVKKGRTIYLTINRLSIPEVAVPDVADNSSLRQAEARILAAGFRLSNHELVSGATDWVYGVKYNGRQLNTGDKAPQGAILTLIVGDGNEQQIFEDSVENHVFDLTEEDFQ